MAVLVPPKVRLQSWKVCNDILPSRSNLRKRVGIDDLTCLRCGVEIENNLHVFFMCPWVRRVWEEWGRNNKEGVRGAWSYKEIVWNILNLSQVNEGEGVAKFVIILWTIWNFRNKLLFESLYQTQEELISGAQSWQKEYKQAHIVPDGGAAGEEVIDG